MRELGFDQARDARRDRRPARRHRARLGGLTVLLAGLALAILPSAAGAITAAPFVTGTSATPTANGATLHVNVYPYGLDTHYHFEYGATSSYGTNAPVPEADVGAAAYPGFTAEQVTISGLASGTTYHFRSVASNSAGPASSADMTFTTLGNAPTVTDEDATELTPTSFELKGAVNPNGSATTYQFEYGTTTSYGSKAPVAEASAGAGSTEVPVSATASALLPNTTYHFRLVAHGGGSQVVTTDRTFLTPPAPPSAPSVATSTPQATATGYKLKGQINPNSLETTYHFDYGTTTGYGSVSPATDATLAAGANSVPVETEITGLAPNTTYHYKIVAHNSEGNGESGDEQFTTPPLKPTVSSLPYGENSEGFTLNGTVNPNGGATTYHFEFGITEAYGENIPGTEVSAGSGSTAVSVSQLVTGLPPEVPYHYRIVAHNAGGTSIGADEFFMTPPEPNSGNPGGEEKPKQETKPPPPPPPPSNAFSVRAGKAKAGVVPLTVTVPGPGTISASGKRMAAAHGSAAAAGAVVLKLKLTGAGKKAMRKSRGHKLAVKATISFTPTGGTAGTSQKTITFK